LVVELVAWKAVRMVALLEQVMAAMWVVLMVEKLVDLWAGLTVDLRVVSLAVSLVGKLAVLKVWKWVVR
jgi:hypothetical protein